MNDLITTATSLTAAAKNVYDVASGMISSRKQNKLVTAAQVHRLENAIRQALEADRMAAIHALSNSERNYLIDSFNQIKDYANTPMGIMLLETVRDEARYMRGYIDDYDRLTKAGGYR